MNVGFIGYGRMGSALAQGAVAAKVVKASAIVAYDPDKASQSRAKKLGAKVAKDAADVIAKADLIFLCVKPQMMIAALAGMQPSTLKKKCFVSIAAGITIAKLQTLLGESTPIFRVMPNTPALLGAGMSAVSRGANASAAQQKRVEKILSSVGKVVSVPEEQMDAVTAVSGSGPAYVFYLAEALTDAAMSLGLSPELAETLVRQTIHGGGRMLSERKEPSAELRRQVTSPGGTTAAAVAVFDRENLRQLIQSAVKSAADRSAELAKS